MAERTEAGLGFVRGWEGGCGGCGGGVRVRGEGDGGEVEVLGEELV